MIWIILTFVFGWLLCGAWSLRMWEKDLNIVEDGQWLFYSIAPLALIIVWGIIWPPRIWKFSKDFGKGIIAAWKENVKGL